MAEALRDAALGSLFYFLSSPTLSPYLSFFALFFKGAPQKAAVLRSGSPGGDKPELVPTLHGGRRGRTASRRRTGGGALHAPSSRMPGRRSGIALASSPEVELASFMIPSTFADSAPDGPPVAALAALAVVGARPTRLVAALRCTVWLCLPCSGSDSRSDSGLRPPWRPRQPVDPKNRPSRRPFARAPGGESAGRSQIPPAGYHRFQRFPCVQYICVCHGSLIPRYEWLPAFDDSHRTPN